MTFYNVIIGILFVGACQAFLARIDNTQGWFAATFLLIVLNEAVSTSDLLERHRPGSEDVDYKLGLKLLDFITFGVLLYALLALSPSNNTIGVDVSTSLNGKGADSPFAFWLLLAIYWVITYFWNKIGGQCDENVWKKWYIHFTKIRFVPFLILSLLSWSTCSFASIAAWPGIIGVIVATFFLLLKFCGRV